MVEKTLSLKKLIQICSLSLLDNKMIKSNCNENTPQTSLSYRYVTSFLKCNSLPCVTQKLYLVTVTSVKYRGTSHHCSQRGEENPSYPKTQIQTVPKFSKCPIPKLTPPRHTHSSCTNGKGASPRIPRVVE